MSSPSLWSLSSRTNEIASIVRANSEVSWKTELCST